MNDNHWTGKGFLWLNRRSGSGVGVGGGSRVQAHYILGTADEKRGGAHPSPFAAVALPDSKNASIYCLVDRVFQSSDGILMTFWPFSAPKPSASNHPNTAPLCVWIIALNSKRQTWEVKTSYRKPPNKVCTCLPIGALFT